MTPEPIDPQPFVWALFALGIALLLGVGIHTFRKRKAPEKPVERPQEEPELLCPCGARVTRALPRVTMWQIPIVGRWWLRTVNTFGEGKVCDPCGRHADAALDEHLAQTVRLAHARMEREIAREMAGHERALLQAVLEALPEPQRKAYERSLRPVVVRQLKAPDEGDAG